MKIVKNASVDLYESGQLKAVNYTATDQTAETLISAATFAARLAFPAPMPGALLNGLRQIKLYCSDAATALLEARARARVAVGTATDAWKLAYENYQKTPSTETRVALEFASAALDAAKAAFTRAQAALVVSDRFVCRPTVTNNALTCDVLEPQLRPFISWFSNPPAELGRMGVISVDLASLGASPPDEATLPKTTSYDGILYRVPRYVLAFATVSAFTKDLEASVPVQRQVSVHQLGHIAGIEITNGLLQENSVTAKAEHYRPLSTSTVRHARRRCSTCSTTWRRFLAT